MRCEELQKALQTTEMRGSLLAKTEKRRNLVNLPKNLKKQKSEQFQQLIVGDSITKNINPSAIVNCDKNTSCNLCDCSIKSLRCIRATASLQGKSWRRQ